MRLYSGLENSLFTSVSMKSIITVVGTIDIRTVWSRSPTIKSPSMESRRTGFPRFEVPCADIHGLVETCLQFS